MQKWRPSPETSADSEEPAEPLPASDSHGDDDAEEVQPASSPAPALPRRVEIQCQEDFGLTKTPVSLRFQDHKYWPYVVGRVVIDKDNNQVLFSDDIDPKQPRKKWLRDIPKTANHVMTKFHLSLPEDIESPQALSEPCEWKLSSHQMRQLTSQVKAAAAVDPNVGDRPLVVEVFSRIVVF